MLRTLAGVAFWVSISAACGERAVSPPIEGDENVFGAEMPSDEEYAAYAKVLPAGVLTGQTAIPAQFQIPAASLPPVQAQGTSSQPGYPGSCEVWSAGYALGSYTANIRNQQPISDPKNTVSTAFVYMLVLHDAKKPCGGGTNTRATLNYLMHNTAPSSFTVSYQPTCPGYLDSIDTTKTYQTDLAIGGWSAIPRSAGPIVALDTIKSHIATSNIVQTSLFVPYGFGKYDPNANGGVFEAPASCPTGTGPPCHQHGAIACSASTKTKSGCGQHGVALVGYDDTRANPRTGEPGAVLIMNSFGPGWGENGFMWMSYATFQAAAFGAVVAEPPTANGVGSALTEAFQRVEPQAGGPPATHLVFRARLDRVIDVQQIMITAPDGRIATQQLVHPLRSGYVYLTRRDGRSFPAGVYTVQVLGRDAEGRLAEVTLKSAVAPGPADTPSAPFPDGLTGTNGQRVR